MSPRPDESTATAADRACWPEIRGYSTRARSPRGHPMTLPESVLEDRCVPALRAVVDAPGLSRCLAPTAVEGTYPRRPRATT